MTDLHIEPPEPVYEAIATDTEINMQFGDDVKMDVDPAYSCDVKIDANPAYQATS